MSDNLDINQETSENISTGSIDELITSEIPTSDLSSFLTISEILGTASLEELKADMPILSSLSCCALIWYMPETRLKEELWQLRNEIKLKAAPELLELANKLFEDFHFDLHYENSPLALELDNFELLELGIKLLNLFNSLEKYEEVELNRLTLELAKIADVLFFPLTDKQLFAQHLPNLTMEEVDLAVHWGMVRNNNIYIPIRNDSRMLLLTAAQNGDIQQVASLLENGANVNQKGIRGATPLYVAVKNEDVAMVELLLKENASPNPALFNGATPLLVAIEQKNINIIKLLVQNGADVNQAAVDGNTPLLNALGGFVIESWNLDEMVKRLIKFYNYTADPEIVEFLLASGANVHYNPSDELLKNIATKNDRAIIELFIKHCVERDSKIPGKEACLATLNEFEEFAAVLSSCKMEGEYSIDCSRINEENTLLGADPIPQEVS